MFMQLLIVFYITSYIVVTLVGCGCCYCCWCGCCCCCCGQCGMRTLYVHHCRMHICAADRSLWRICQQHYVWHAIDLFLCCSCYCCERDCVNCRLDGRHSGQYRRGCRWENTTVSRKENMKGISLSDYLLNPSQLTANNRNISMWQHRNRKYYTDTQPKESNMTQQYSNSRSAQISSPLSVIFNISLRPGIHPDLLKIAKIIPIFKKGSQLSTKNYRPISLLSNLCSTESAIS